MKARCLVGQSWYVLATLLETDNELAAKVYKRMQESLAGER